MSLVCVPLAIKRLVSLSITSMERKAIVLPRRKVSACMTIVLPAPVAGLMKCTSKSTETPGAMAPAEVSDIMAIVVMESTRVAANPACR